MLELPDEAATLALGARLAAIPALNGLIFLRGELGAGKTTLVRGFLRALGHEGIVKSPTYTLIEPYELAARSIFHLDIYRLGDPSELDELGVRDLLKDNNTLLLEWPERAQGALKAPDMEISLEYEGDARKAVLTSRHPGVMESLANDQSLGQPREQISQ